ncbi:hypothetical protein PROFUN_08882 [Planoprotostelium fungivorum]|uniref:Uncharacterized protein n=1 Tax=Planoprotostelium fungivorum TaxID=1890364 RepID=A0A2P6NIT6_9EUKA|nr:hypothetical protein PROFUN_08882 [Planoprotostelium fungivorum]
MEVRQTIVEAHNGQITCVTFNVMSQRLITGSEDHNIKLPTLFTGEVYVLFISLSMLVSGINNIAFFSSSLDGTIVAWSSMYKTSWEKKLNVPCSCLVWDKKRHHLAAGFKESVYLYRLTKNRLDSWGGDSGSELLEVVTIVRMSGEFVRCMLYHDNRIVTGSFDRSISIFDSSNGRRTLKISNAHKAAVSVMTADEDNNRFITGGFDKKVKIWNWDGTVVFEIGGFVDPISGICYNPITKTIWVGASSAAPQIFDPLTGINITEFVPGVIPKQQCVISSILFIPNTGEIVGTSTNNRGLIVWRHNPFSAVCTIKGSDSVVEALTYSSNRFGPQIFSGGADRTIHKWELLNETDIQAQERYRGHTDSVLCLEYYDTLDMLISGSSDKLIRLWTFAPLPRNDIDTRSSETSIDLTLPENEKLSKSTAAQVQKLGQNFLEKITGLGYKYVLPGHSDIITGLVAFRRPDGHFLISVSWDANIIIWDLNRDNNHAKKVIQDAHLDYITDVTYSPDRSEFGTCAVDGSVYIWSFGTKFEKLRTLVGHTAEVTSIKWNKERQQWMTASQDSTIRLWNGDGRCVKCIRCPTGVTSMCIEKNMGHALVACVDLVIRLYNLHNEDIIQENRGHSDVVTDMVWIEETNQFMTCSWDHTIRLWNGPTKRMLGQTSPDSNHLNSIAYDLNRSVSGNYSIQTENASPIYETGFSFAAERSKSTTFIGAPDVATVLKNIVTSQHSLRKKSMSQHTASLATLNLDTKNDAKPMKKAQLSSPNLFPPKAQTSKLPPIV